MKVSRSVRNWAKYSAAPKEGSFSSSRFTNSSVKHGFSSRDAPFATKMRGSPFAPKCALKASHKTPLRRCGEEIAISGPPVVAKLGLTAAKISVSGLDDASDMKNAISSKTAATQV